MFGRDFKTLPHQQCRASKGEQYGGALQRRGKFACQENAINRQKQAGAIGEQRRVAELGLEDADMPGDDIHRKEEAREQHQS